MIDWTPMATIAIAAVPSSGAVADSGLTDWAGIGSAIAAAIAALAALATVLQNRRIINATLRPRLTGIVLPAVDPDPALQIHNTGGAVAIAVRALWASGERRAEGDVGPGIGPGEHATVLASLPKEGLADSHGVLIYADALRNHYADSLDGHSWIFRNRWWKRKFTQPALDDLYADFYGSSIAEWESVELRVARRASDALVVEPPKRASTA